MKLNNKVKQIEVSLNKSSSNFYRTHDTFKSQESKNSKNVKFEGTS